MAQGGRGGGVNVLEADVEASLGERADFAGENERLRAARAAAKAQVLVRDADRRVRLRVRGEHKAHRVVLHMRRDRHLPHEPLQLRQRGTVADLVHGHPLVLGGASDHFGEVRRVRIANDELEEEAVELRLGQRISSLLVNRVLRREHEERLDQFADLPARRDALLLHRFEHRGLRLGRGAVDFVREDNVRKDRPALELKLPPSIGRFHHHVRAENVGGHQIGRELDAVERQFQHLAQRPHEQRLAQTRHALQQHMPAREDGDERAIHDVRVPDDDLADLVAQRGETLAEGGDLLLGVHRVGCRLKVEG